MLHLNNLESQRKWREFVREWEAKRALVQGRKSCEAFNQLAPVWKIRNQACDHFLDVLKQVGDQSQPDLTPLLGALAAVDKAGGHPEAEPHRLEVSRLHERDKAWKIFSNALQTALAANSLDTDKKALSAWR